MFRGWDSFYLLVGSGAGALIGIMFVVATLTAGYESRLALRGSRVYITPIVFHFSVILVVSIISAVPELPPMMTGGILAVCAAVGLAYSLTTAVRMITADWAEPPDLSDKLFYGVFPSVLYLLFGAASIWIGVEHAVYAVGAAMLLLLLIGIRNAWDLATYLVMHPEGPQRKRENKKK